MIKLIKNDLTDQKQYKWSKIIKVIKNEQSDQKLSEWSQMWKTLFCYHYKQKNQSYHIKLSKKIR